MTFEQRTYSASGGWSVVSEKPFSGPAQLVLLFGSTALLTQEDRIKELKEAYPDARLVGCSTAGEILNTAVSDDSISATAINLEKTNIEIAETDIKGMEDSLAAGERLAKELPQEGLKHVIVFSEGVHVNGSELVKGLTGVLSNDVVVTGGLAGDHADFKETVVCVDGPGRPNIAVVVGLYGESIRIGHGSMGGWDPFGPERLVTKSEANVLYELDGKPALELYKEYLGDQADGLPATGLLFPLSMKLKENNDSLVRTILAVDEAANSLTFAGDVVEGSTVQLMKANFDRLVDGAGGAADMAHVALEGGQAELALLISCVGRKLVLKQRVEEETEHVKSILGEQVTITGFYSYGEISPSAATSNQCALHNQTMTITTFLEV